MVPSRRIDTMLPRGPWMNMRNSLADLEQKTHNTKDRYKELQERWFDIPQEWFDEIRKETLEVLVKHAYQAFGEHELRTLLNTLELLKQCIQSTEKYLEDLDEAVGMYELEVSRESSVSIVTKKYIGTADKIVHDWKPRTAAERALARKPKPEEKTNVTNLHELAQQAAREGTLSAREQQLLLPGTIAPTASPSGLPLQPGVFKGLNRTQSRFFPGLGETRTRHPGSMSSASAVDLNNPGPITKTQKENSDAHVGMWLDEMPEDVNKHAPEEGAEIDYDAKEADDSESVVGEKARQAES